MTSEGIEFRPVTVAMDGGPCEARLAFSDDVLLCVFTRVGPEDGAGWFREAGFGACSDLFTVQPGVFTTLEEAGVWIRDRLRAMKAGSSSAGVKRPPSNDNC